MKNFKKVLVVIILAAIAVGYYFYLSKRPNVDTTDKVVQKSKIEKILSEDAKTVTKTPKACVKYYSEIIECLYNEEHSDEEIKSLGTKARDIFDTELNNNNPDETYLVDLNSEVLEYSKAGRIVMSYTVDSSDEVQYYTEGEKEYAIVNASYTLREKDAFTKANEEYILRKDEEGQWKILGWRIANNEDSNDQKENE